MHLVNWLSHSQLLVHSRSLEVGSLILPGALQWVGSTASTLFLLRYLTNLIVSYALNWLVTLPLEITAASITLQFWDGSRNINPAAWVTIFLVVIICINFFGVRGYGEAEFVFSIIKVAAVIGFIILGIIIDCGGVPGGQYIGARYWYSPGAFNHGFKGLCSVFVTAAFSFGGNSVNPKYLED